MFCRLHTSTRLIMSAAQNITIVQFSFLLTCAYSFVKNTHQNAEKKRELEEKMCSIMLQKIYSKWLKWMQQFDQFLVLKSTVEKRKAVFLNKDENEIKDDKAVFVLRFNISQMYSCVPKWSTHTCHCTFIEFEF